MPYRIRIALPEELGPISKIPQFRIKWQLSTSMDFKPSHIVNGGTITATPAEEADVWLALAMLSDLKAGETYFYQFSALSLGILSPMGSFTTRTEDKVPEGTGVACRFLTIQPSVSVHKI